MMRTVPIGLALLLSACMGSLLDTDLPVPTLYVLAPAPVGEPIKTLTGVDLAISQPTTAPGLDTERIAVLREARRLDYYRDSQWGSALPWVVQSLIVGSLQNQKLFGHVTSEQARVNANYLLDVEIRDFQAEYSNGSVAPTVKVTLVGSIIRVRDRRLIAVAPATVTVAASANRMSAVIEAFESAAQQAALSLGQQTAHAILTQAAD